MTRKVAHARPPAHVGKKNLSLEFEILEGGKIRGSFHAYGWGAHPNSTILFHAYDTKYCTNIMGRKTK